MHTWERRCKELITAVGKVEQWHGQTKDRTGKWHKWHRNAIFGQGELKEWGQHWMDTGIKGNLCEVLESWMPQKLSYIKWKKMGKSADKNLNCEKMNNFKYVSPASENICMKALVKLHTPDAAFVLSRAIA